MSRLGFDGGCYKTFASSAEMLDELVKLREDVQRSLDLAMNIALLANYHSIASSCVQCGFEDHLNTTVKEIRKLLKNSEHESFSNACTLTLDLIKAQSQSINVRVGALSKLVTEFTELKGQLDDD